MKLVLIIGLGLVLRLISLDQSLWLDEAITAQVVKKTPIEIVTQFSVADFHPPTYYWLMAGWSRVCPNSETCLRLPSVVFGLVTIGVIYSLYGTGAGLLVAVNPLLIYYSQEARMYSMATMLFVLTWWAVKKEKWVLVNVFSGLALGSFYGVGLGWAGVNIYWIISKNYKNILKGNWGVLTVLIILVPLLREQIKAAGSQLSGATNWAGALGKTNLKNLGLIPLKFAIGRVSFYPKIIYWGLGGLWTVIIWSGLVVNKTWKKAEVIIILLTVLVGIIVSIKVPMMSYFRFIYLLPLTLAMLPKNWWLVTGFTAWSLFYLLVDSQHREDWKSASHSLGGNQVYMISTFGDPVNFYRPEIKVKDIRGEIEGDVIEVIPYGQEIHGLNHNQILVNKNYKRVKQTNLRGMVTESWQKN
jgi:hypothetical protein